MVGRCKGDLLELLTGIQMGGTPSAGHDIRISGEVDYERGGVSSSGSFNDDDQMLITDQHANIQSYQYFHPVSFDLLRMGVSGSC